MNVGSKVLIIGIDGGTWDVLAPACEQGWMPHLNRFRQKGCWGTLRSTHPPFTPPAWAALMTGQNPGHHGVLGFHEYDPKENQVRLTNSSSIRTETLWQKLTRHGKRVVVAGVPMTYPVTKLNGLLVSGFDTPSTESDFTYPRSFKQQILKEIPDFCFERRWRREHVQRIRDFSNYIKWLRKDTEQWVKILRLGMENVDWDLSMVVFRSFDRLLHCFWKFLDFSCDTAPDPRSAFIPQYFQDLDEIIGELIHIAQDNDAITFVVSDHGGQAELGSIYPNRVLRELGYLKMASKWRLLLNSAQKRWIRWCKSRPEAKFWALRTTTQKINFDKTWAYITAVSSYADLNLQVKNRQPNGIVEPQNVDAMITEIADALRKVTDSDGLPLFGFAERPTELYGLPEPMPHMPDLIIAPREGYSSRMHVTGRAFINHVSDDSLTGIHSINGMFGALGPGVVSGKDVNADIIDIAPTVLAALNLPVTEDMDGRVISEIFEKLFPVTYEPSHRQKVSDGYVYSRQEDKEIASRLADLGYL